MFSPLSVLGYTLWVCLGVRETFDEPSWKRLYREGGLRFKWRNKRANKGESKPRLKRPRISPKLHTRHKDNPVFKVSKVYFHIHIPHPTFSILRTKVNLPYKVLQRSYFATRSYSLILSLGRLWLYRMMWRYPFRICNWLQ